MDPDGCAWTKPPDRKGAQPVTLAELEKMRLKATVILQRVE